MLPIPRSLFSFMYGSTFFLASPTKPFVRTRSTIPCDLSLCPVISKNSMSEKEFHYKVTRLIQGGATCFQLREPNEKTALESAGPLKKILDQKNIPLIINDFVLVALALKAAGVHLGQQDLDCHLVRSLLGKKPIIGLTVESIEDVLRAKQCPIDYIGLQIFPSKRTKPHHTHLWGPEGLRKINELIPDLRLRKVLIGGLKKENLHLVLPEMKLGARQDGLAMASTLCKPKDPYLPTKEIKDLLIERGLKKNI